MTDELMKELEELRQYKRETFYRLTDEDISVMLQDIFCDVEIEQDDIDRIMERARYKFDLEWAEPLYWFVDTRFPDILEKYRSLEKQQEAI